jgi:hypothetical protein
MNRYIPVTRIPRLARLALGGLLLGVTLAASAADTPAWIAKSNANAQVLVDNLAKFAPEFAGRMGVTGYDDKIADLLAKAVREDFIPAQQTK